VGGGSGGFRGAPPAPFFFPKWPPPPGWGDRRPPPPPPNRLAPRRVLSALNQRRAAPHRRGGRARGCCARPPSPLSARRPPPAPTRQPPRDGVAPVTFARRVRVGSDPTPPLVSPPCPSRLCPPGDARWGVAGRGPPPSVLFVSVCGLSAPSPRGSLCTSVVARCRCWRPAGARPPRGAVGCESRVGWRPPPTGRPAMPPHPASRRRNGLARQPPAGMPPPAPSTGEGMDVDGLPAALQNFMVRAPSWPLPRCRLWSGL